MPHANKALFTSSHRYPRLMLDTALGEQKRITLSKEQSHYIARVMRLKPGDTVRVFNGCDGQWLAKITAATAQSVTLTCTELLQAQYTVPDLMVCFAPPRGGRIDTIIEKTTELGARFLQPVRTTHSVVDSVNEKRLHALMREAAEQCERMDIPTLLPMVTLQDLLRQWPFTRQLYYGDESGASSPLLPNMLGNPPSVALNTAPACFAVLAGPEGGFTQEELGLLQNATYAQGVALGPRILRVDTAIITLCALTQQCYGDWQHRPRFHPSAPSAKPPSKVPSSTEQ